MLLPLLVTILPSFADPALASTAEPVASEVDILRLVPREAFLVARTAPLDTLRADLAGNAWWQLLQDPALASLGEGIDELEAHVANELEGLDPRDLLASIHGQVAVYVAAGASFDDPGFGLVFEPGQEAQPFRELFATLRSKAALGADAKQGTHRGVSYELLVERSSDAGSSGGGGTLAFVEHAGVVAWLGDDDEAGARAAAQGLIERLQRAGGASMAEHPGLAAARARTHGPTRAELFVDLTQVSRKIAADAEAGTSEERMIRELGLDRLEWLHARADVAAGESLDLEIAVSLPREGALASWLGALHAPSAKLLAKIPQGAAALGLVGFDVQRVWSDAWASFGRVDGAASAKARAEMQAGAQAFLGLDVERDLIGQLSGEFAQFAVEVPAAEVGALLGLALGDGATPAGPALGEVHVIGLTDPLALEATVEGLIERFGFGEMIGEEEVAGQELAYVELGEGARFSWSFGPDCLMLSVSPTALQRALEHAAKPEAPSAATDPRFARVLAENSDAAMLSVASTPLTLKALGGVLELAASLDSDVPSLGDWSGLVDRYLRGALTSTLRYANGEVRLHLRAR